MTSHTRLHICVHNAAVRTLFLIIIHLANSCIRIIREMPLCANHKNTDGWDEGTHSCNEEWPVERHTMRPSFRLDQVVIVSPGLEAGEQAMRELVEEDTQSDQDKSYTSRCYKPADALPCSAGLLQALAEHKHQQANHRHHQDRQHHDQNYTHRLH